MTLSSVVLPQPDAPMATTNSLSRKSRFTSSRALTTPSPSTAGNSTPTRFRLTIAVMPACGPDPVARPERQAARTAQQLPSRTIRANFGVAESE